MLIHHGPEPDGSEVEPALTCDAVRAISTAWRPRRRALNLRLASLGIIILHRLFRVYICKGLPRQDRNLGMRIDLIWGWIKAWDGRQKTWPQLPNFASQPLGCSGRLFPKPDAPISFGWRRRSEALPGGGRAGVALVMASRIRWRVDDGSASGSDSACSASAANSKSLIDSRGSPRIVASPQGGATGLRRRRHRPFTNRPRFCARRLSRPSGPRSRSSCPPRAGLRRTYRM